MGECGGVLRAHRRGEVPHTQAEVAVEEVEGGGRDHTVVHVWGVVKRGSEEK